jgi:hypothetical protein
VQMEVVLTWVDANESDFVHEMAPKKKIPPQPNAEKGPGRPSH